jgi:hypothetical protein
MDKKRLRQTAVEETGTVSPPRICQGGTVEKGRQAGRGTVRF